MALKKKQWIMPALAALTCLLAATTAVLLAAFHIRVRQMTQSGLAESQVYARHYALIAEEGEPFWDTVYSGAQAYAEAHGACVERFGEGLAVSYTRAQRLKMAIAAGVDGILLEADASDEMGVLIQQATDAGIAVVTVMDDHYGGSQQCFVGLSSYDLGREYGRQIIRNATADTRSALIIMDTNTADSDQNILYNGIRETLANEGNHLTLTLSTLAVSGEGAFGPEQAVRTLLLSGEVPEIIICLDAKTTACVSQAAVDLNMVGQVRIIGSYTNTAILNAIDRGVIAATVAVDGGEMGRQAAAALDNYLSGGKISDYQTLDVTAITKNNIKEYLKDAQ